MNLQKNIDLIFLSPKNKEEKLVELKKLLSPFHQIIYTDFDDTLTDEKSLLYTKVKWLKKKGKAIDDIFLQKHTILHQKTLQLLAQRNFKELIIISRNDHQVLKLFIKLFSHQFQEQGIHIKACIGC
ncbi:MAG: hypothetical protein LBH96_03880 [Candidatus Peribacteria bacterium]|jgi:2-hydroxy-3-keto-5-methylthiopentenyl-1-phosphate phosphatase|nr:hypothetical protein [Candidatus Peribacteria bacterium]